MRAIDGDYERCGLPKGQCSSSCPKAHSDAELAYWRSVGAHSMWEEEE